MALAEQVQSRSRWVEDVCGMKIGDALAKLDEIYNANCGQAQVSAVVGLMSQWAGGADSPADASCCSHMEAISRTTNYYYYYYYYYLKTTIDVNASFAPFSSSQFSLHSQFCGSWISW